MNVENRTIFEGDNLHILRGLDSETIDLIYLDPPFNSNKTYEAPIGSDAAGAAFKDSWTLSDLDDAWHGELAESEPALYSAISAAEFTHSKSMKAYLIMMGIRMLEMKRVLKDTGSIYLHCDPTASHYLKTMMDAVFGHSSFRNEIVWYYKGNSIAKKLFPAKHDTILYYATRNCVFHPVLVPYAESTLRRYNHADKDGRRYKISALRDGKQEKVYMKEGKPADTVWDIPVVRKKKERTGYPTQKPLALLERIIRASSNRGDMVLDPFCGCATTCVAAERLQRQWIGIDLSAKAVDLVKMRLERDENLTEHEGLLGDKIIHRKDIPKREVPEEPKQISLETLFRMPTLAEQALTPMQLWQYRSYKHTLFGLQEGKCNGCQVLLPFRNMTIDHILPRSKGGGNNPDNLQLLCAACNSTKGDRSQAELIESLKANGVLSHGYQ